MTHPDWASLRTHTINRFNGETPHPTTETDIIRAYELHPDALEKAIHAVAADFHAGVIRSGWGVLRHRAEAILAPPANPQAKTGRDLEKRRARAEQWIRNAGFHYSWGECEEELQAMLGVDAVPQHLHDLHTELHPNSARLEQEAEDRAGAWREGQQRLKELRAAKLRELDAAQNSGAAPARTAGTHVAQHGTGQTPPVPAPETDFPPPKETT